METGMRDRERHFCGPNGGLDSLAAAASCRTELNGTEEDLEFKDEKAERQEDTLKGQKGKVRKAYTITKQRERWTDGEHERFLQALKRYGRAWRKIEEHIGTKTAVQIRSHAQKFFSKLQREQSTSGGPGEESSKAGISIPPPRPKRKPSHPYPRKHNASSEADHSGDMETEKETPSMPAQPSSTPSYMAPPGFQPATVRDNANLSLSQVLESAAAAAAIAWSQVVATAGPKVQQQLQAHVAAHQVQPVYNMQSQHSNAASLPNMNAKHRQVPNLRDAIPPKNLQSGSQHYSNQPLQQSFGHGLYSSSSPTNIVTSAQESPTGGGNASATGNDRDSACSREHSRDSAGLHSARPISIPFQGISQHWAGAPSSAMEVRLGRAARSMMQARTQPITGIPAHQLITPSKLPHRSASATADLNQEPQGKVHDTQRALGKGLTAGDGKFRGQNSKGCSSDISQLAHFYQQAAADDQCAAENGEHGSSGAADGGSGSGRSTHDGKRSDKGSNNNNTSGSEDEHANGSDGTTATADLMAQEGKGSDDGSNSPVDVSLRSPKAEPVDKGNSQPQRHLMQPLLFGLGSAVDPTCLANSPSHWPTQPVMAPAPALDSHTPQTLPQALSQQQLGILQQQALQAWAATAQQTLPNYTFLQNIVNSLQSQTAGINASDLAAAPSAMTGSKHLQLEQRSSDVPSMDTYNASNRSFSVPAFTIDSDGKKHSPGSVSGKGKGEEQSGFKPYSKKHGMPIASLPPSKRFAAIAAANLDRPVAVKPQPVQRLYTPFSAFTAQGKPISPGANQ